MKILLLKNLENELVRFAKKETDLEKAKELIKKRSFMGPDGTLYSIDRLVVDPFFNSQEELQHLIESSGFVPSGSSDFIWKRAFH